MEPESKQASSFSEQLQLVTFSIGSEEFGVDILNVREIDRILDITRVPESPDFVEGIINLRGQVVPLVNLRRRLGMDSKIHDKHTRILVADVAGQTIGFSVDAVREVFRISSEVFEVPPEIIGGVRSHFIKSVAKSGDRLLILIDLEKILSGKQKQDLSEIT